jgi:hypothetical protein
MFSLLVSVGALFLAVFVSAILDPRPSRTEAADERARADDGYDYLTIVGTPLRDRTGRRLRVPPSIPVLPVAAS